MKKIFGKIKQISVICLLVVFSFNLTLLATDKELKDEIFVPEVDYSYFKLENGLQIYVFEDHQLPLTKVAVWYNVGSCDEPEGITGISHMLEHTMFLGTDTLKKDQIHKLVKSVGGSNNASTNYYYTSYYEEVPSANLELAMAIEADRMRNLKFDIDEFKREKEVVKQERRMRIENNAIRSAYEEIRTTAFEKSPYHHSVVGWMKDLNNMTAEDVSTYYKKYYAPNNSILVVSGDANPQKVYQLAQKYYGDYKPQKITRRDTSEPEQKREKTITIEKFTKVPYIIMLYKIPEGNHQDMVAIDFLLDILINKPTARVITELKQKKEILLGAGSSTTSSPIPGYTEVYLVPTTEDKIEEVQVGFELELNKLIKEGVSTEELAVLKKNILKNLILDQRSALSFSGDIISSTIKYNQPELYKKRIEWIKDLTKEDIVRVAKKYFIKEKRTVGYIIPEKNNESSIKKAKN